jgi:peptide/nickel transport system permease protein
VRVAKLVERLLATVALMVAIAVFVFVAMRLLPGDPVDLILNQGGQVNEAQLRALRANYNLDQSIPQQLLAFVGGLAHGDMGQSVSYQRPVAEIIRQHLPATIELTVVAVIISLLLAVPAGVIAAVKRGTALDRAISGVTFVGVSVPGFWLGIVMILVFSVGLHWLPTSSRAAAGADAHGVTGFYLVDALLALNFSDFGTALKHLLLPAIALGAVMTAVLTRVLRSTMIEELQKDYVVLARAKGASEIRVVLRHVLPNALIPAITILGLQVGSMLGGNMLIETVFSWPGIGRLAVEGIFARDYPLVQGVVILFAFIFAIANLLVDLAYLWLNPRVTL